MFCPKCGQEQATESVHFCSRCGFKLSIIEEGLAKRLTVMAMYLVITICALGGWGSITAGPAYMQIRVFISVIAAITFYLLFSGDLTHIFNRLFSKDIEEGRQISSPGQETALPPAHSIPAAPLGSRRVNTAEMVPPPSVTEQTTTLLDKNKHRTGERRA
ncbi:MAG TPA: zinc ribbon domain-containing protein [Pyrinomonadaceae bacterium]